MVRMYLELCTSNLTPETVNELVMENISGVVAYTYEEGMFIIVPNQNDFCFDYKLEELPSDLVKLLKYAWKNHITLIRLDRDAEEFYDGLPVYQWK